MKSKSSNALRSFIRKEVRGVLKEAGLAPEIEDKPKLEPKAKVEPKAEPEAKPKAEPKTEPEAKPKAKQEERPVVVLTRQYIGKIKQNVGTPEASDIEDMVTSILQAWDLTSTEKLSVLKSVRNNTVH